MGPVAERRVMIFRRLYLWLEMFRSSNKSWVWVRQGLAWYS